MKIFLHVLRNAGAQWNKKPPVEYWQEMYERYTNWINNFHECPILRININDYDLYKDESSLEEIISKIGYILNESKAYKKYIIYYVNI